MKILREFNKCYYEERDIMFKDLTKFQKGCLVVTVLETIVIYGGLALVSKSLNKELKEKEDIENELQQLALKEANKVKSL